MKLWSYEAFETQDDIVDVDEGIDIIALDTEGKICAIQAKCWGISKKLPYREISTFLACPSSSYIDYRLLIATCELGRKASRQIRYQNEQKQVHTFLLSDFTRWDTRWPASLDALVISFHARLISQSGTSWQPSMPCVMVFPLAVGGS